MRHILVAVSGETPQIITETAWSLTQEQRTPLSEIHVLTTARGARAVQEKLLDTVTGEFWRFCREYGVSSESVRFSVRDTVHVMKGLDGAGLEDIRSSADSEAARRQIFDVVRKLTEDPEVCLHGVIAGGRKSMSYLLGAAFGYFGRPHDRLYHVLVQPPELERSRDFFFIPKEERGFVVDAPGAGEVSSLDARIELAELRFVSLRDLVRLEPETDYSTIEAQVQDDLHQHPQLKEENRRLRASLGQECGQILGTSAAMNRVRDQIRRASSSGITVLVLGETGTGKELVARALHQLSERQTRPFRPVNCAGLHDNLLETTLFGSIRGAFTGALDRKGVFQDAEGGTVFLDEIGDLPPKGQGDLLRVLQEQVVTPVGSAKETPVDVWVIAATNRNLVQMIEDGTFRRDLFYRLNTCIIAVPPLRERREDIVVLVSHFLAEFNRKHGMQVRGFTPEATKRLNTYSWPGNIRQLENVVEQVVVAARSGAVRVREDELPLEISPLEERDQQLRAALELPFKEGLEVFERMQLMKALEGAAGNKKQAAQALGISRQTLDNKLGACHLNEWAAQLKGRS